jgi:hypothetical protein
MPAILFARSIQGRDCETSRAGIKTVLRRTTEDTEETDSDTASQFGQNFIGPILPLRTSERCVLRHVNRTSALEDNVVLNIRVSVDLR